MKRLEISGLPDDPLAAAGEFHALWLGRIKAELADGTAGLTICFQYADHRHKSWRLAMMQELARTQAPHRVNAISGGSATQRDAARAFLDNCQGVTGQYLVLGGQDVVSDGE